jgi:large subunit ribosomal protein L29
MAVDSVKDLGESQLVERLAEEKDRLFKLRFQLATGQLDNAARIRTELRAREIEAAEAAVGSEAS